MEKHDCLISQGSVSQATTLNNIRAETMREDAALARRATLMPTALHTMLHLLDATFRAHGCWCHSGMILSFCNMSMTPLSLVV